MRHRLRGFTLIELIIVIVIIATLALVAVPTYVDITTKTKESTLKGQLGSIRAAIALEYAKSAVDGSPAYPATLTDAMFSSGVPTDPFEDSKTVTASAGSPIVADDFDDDGGWIYDSATGTVRADLEGKHDW